MQFLPAEESSYFGDACQAGFKNVPDVAVELFCRVAYNALRDDVSD